MPFILSKPVTGLAADIAPGVGTLKIIVRNTQQEIREAVAAADATLTVGADKSVVAVAKKIVQSVVLVRRETASKLPGVGPFDPGQRVGVGVGGARFMRRTCLVRAERQTVVELHQRGARV